MASPKKLPVFHQIIRILGAVGVWLDEFFSLTEELFVFRIVLFEMRVIGGGEIIVSFDLGDPKWGGFYLLL